MTLIIKKKALFIVSATLAIIYSIVYVETPEVLDYRKERGKKPTSVRRFDSATPIPVGTLEPQSC